MSGSGDYLDRNRRGAIYGYKAWQVRTMTKRTALVLLFSWSLLLTAGYIIWWR